MGKHIYIDGGIVATTGNLYSRDCFAGDLHWPKGAKRITPPNGVVEITQDTGSIFDTYHASGFVTASGIEVGSIRAFKDIYQFTVAAYHKNRDLLTKLLSTPPQDELLYDLFYQEQFSMAFSLLERFLNDTFVRQTCDKEESYHRVLDSKILTERRVIRDREEIRIIKGEDGLKKELLYIRAVNHIVYHRFDLVQDLFSVAFNISIDLNDLKDALDIRNDIVHRFGRSEYGTERHITEFEIIQLMEMIDRIVLDLSNQVSRLAPSE